MTFPLPSSLTAGALASAVFAVSLAVAGPAFAQPKAPETDHSGLPPKLSGEEIRAQWFDGQPFVATGPDGTAYKMVFTGDGKAARVAVAAKKPKPVIGYWRVIAEGYCSRWTGTNREKRFNVRKSPDGSETIVRFGLQVAATWKRP